jgi:hypothetical protein
MSFARSISRQARLRQAARFQVENLERRVLLSSAIAAFNPQQAFSTGTNPLALAVADVNRDGKPDLIVANNTDGNVGVLLGDGTGSFLNQQTFASGPTPIALAVADVNGDGKPDLIVANYDSSSVSVLLGNGDGTFQNPQSFATGSGPIAVTTADVNGDGKADILVANYSSGTMSVLDGSGDGTFQPQQTFVAGAHPISIAAADLNGDGKPDIAVSNYTSSTVSVLLGTGNGSFSAPQTFAVGGKPRSIVVSDINTDGKPDLVVVNKTDDTASILLGNGDGTFATQLTSYVGASPNAVAVADVNGDGKEDLVVADGGTTYPGNVAVLLGNRDGTFQPAVNFNAGANPYSVAVADLNDDGRLDIATANQRGNSVSVLLGDVPPTVLSINRTNPPGPITSDSSVIYTVTFSEPVTGVDPTDFTVPLTGAAGYALTQVSGSGSVYTLTISGITGNGTLGLNLVDNNSIHDLAGNPLRTGVAAFGAQSTLATGAGPAYVTAADVNGDGIPDLIVTNLGSNSVGVLLGNGNGTFQSEQTFATELLPAQVVVADLNGDGKPDLVVENVNDRSVSVLLGNGNGTFHAQQTFARGFAPSSVVVSDLNGDGKPDLVITTISDDVSVLLGNGDGTFQSQITFAVGSKPISVACADLNGDGNQDLVVSNYLSNDVSVLLGNGNGTFQAQQTFATGTGPFGVAVSDINGDGQPDLVVADQNSNAVSVLLGNGNGTFQSQVTFATGFQSQVTFAGSGPRYVAAPDLNGDGKPDLIVTNAGIVPGSGSVSVLLGNGNGTFHAPETFAAGPRPYGIAVADMNGDGRPDVIVGNSAGSNVSLLLNAGSGNFTGQTYTIVPSVDTITGTAGIDQITLVQDPDHTHLDWTLNGSTAQMSINDANGLTINGNGGNDTITLDYTNGNPLPNIMHLNSGTGNFTINGFQGPNPLAGTTLDMGRSIVFISYSTSDPLTAIQGYLQAGYNGGTWNGTPTASTGVITSAAAQANANHTTAIGYADSADSQGINTTSNTIELKYTLYGDASLDGQVNSADLQRLLASFNTPGAWDQGDFNYDGVVNSADLQALLATFNTALGSQATPLSIAATPAATTTPATNTSSDPSPQLLPAIQATGSTNPLVHHPLAPKAAVRKRR